MNSVSNKSYSDSTQTIKAYHTAFEHGHWDTALLHLKKMQKSNLFYTSYLEYEKTLYIKLGRFQDALKISYESIKKPTPQNYELHFHLLKKVGEDKEAEIFYKVANQLFENVILEKYLKSPKKDLD